MDKNAIIKALRDYAQAASNEVANTVAGPVDLINTGLGYVGLGSKEPIGGSAWMRRQGLTAPVPEGTAQLLGETTGLVLPMVGAAKATEIAAALRGMGENIAKPKGGGMAGGQRGAIDLDVLQGPQAEALKLAQQRAALPVSKGGLGLPANNTAAERAKAMDFTTDSFHATDYDILKLEKEYLGSNTGAPSAKKAFFSAGHPRTTYAYINEGVTGTDPTYALIYGKTWSQLNKELEQYAHKLGVQPYQIRDEFFDNLPHIYNQNLDNARAKLSSAIKEIPGKKIFNRHIPDMELATPEQIQKVNKAKDEIEELVALESMVTRQPQFIDSLDDVVEKEITDRGANIMPLKINAKNAQIYDDANAGYRTQTYSNRIDEAIQNKKDLAIINNTQDGYKKSDTIYAVINPDIVRSRFAAFDPFRRTAAIAAAMGVAAPDLLAKEQQPIPPQNLVKALRNGN